MNIFCHNKQCRFHLVNHDSHIHKYIVWRESTALNTNKQPSYLSNTLITDEVEHHRFHFGDSVGANKKKEVFFCDFCLEALYTGNFTYMQKSWNH